VHFLLRCDKIVHILHSGQDVGRMRRSPMLRRLKFDM
jgi:hypothetical protein